MKSVAPVIGYTAEKGWTWLGRGAERIREWVGAVHNRAEAAGISEQLHAARDVTEKAIPIVASSGSSDKRQMIEDVILSFATRSAEVGAEVAAIRALRMIDELTDEGVLVFATMSAMPEAGSPTGETHTFSQLRGLRLPWFMEDEGLRELSKAGLIQIDEWHPEEDGSPNPPIVIDEWSLTSKGAWLRSWVLTSIPTSRLRHTDRPLR
jgi:hypothetical protein